MEMHAFCNFGPQRSSGKFLDTPLVARGGKMGIHGLAYSPHF